MELRILERFVQKIKRQLTKQIQEKYREVQNSSIRFPLFLKSLYSEGLPSGLFIQEINSAQNLSPTFEQSFIDSATEFWFFRFCMLRLLDASNFSAIKIISTFGDFDEKLAESPHFLDKFSDENLSSFSIRLSLLQSEQFFHSSVPANLHLRDVPFDFISFSGKENSLHFAFLEKLISHYWDILPENIQEGIQSAFVPKVQDSIFSILPWLLFLDNNQTVADFFPDFFDKTPIIFQFVLPIDFSSRKSFIPFLVDFLTKETCQQDELLGWFYQFWQSDQKRQIMGKPVRNEDIPLATQLFTPHWIVKYLLQNSLGNFWLKKYPESKLRHQMSFESFSPTDSSWTPQKSTFLSQSDEFDIQSSKFACSLLDPACGCGHILIEAYDFFKNIYIELKKPLQEIPQIILTQHLFGLDIDEKAIRLTRFALYLKALKDNPNLGLQGSESGQISSLFDHFVAFENLDASMIADIAEISEEKSIPQTFWILLQNFKTFGSLVQIPFSLATDIQQELKSFLESSDWQSPQSQQIIPKTVSSFIPQQNIPKIPENNRQEKIKRKISENEIISIRKIAKALQILSGKYNIIVCNPPYMGRRGMNDFLKQFADKYYPNSKSDLYSMFIERSFDWASSDGFIAMITMQSWLFLPSFKNLRTLILDQKTLLNVAHLGVRAFEAINGEVVSVAAFILKNQKQTNQPCHFFRLIDYPEKIKEIALKNQWNHYELKNLDFIRRLPHSPFLYWIDEKMLQQLSNPSKMGDFAAIKQGLATSNNQRFLRRWFEVDYHSIAFYIENQENALASGKKWFPYNKGGEQRKWYGNQDFVIDWQNNGQAIKECRPRSFIRNESYYFRESISWSKVSSALPTLRYYPSGHLFDVAGCSIFCSSTDELFLLLAYCNSSLFQYFMNAASSTINLEIGQMVSLPLSTSLIMAGEKKGKKSLKINSETAPILKNAKRLVHLSQTDWNLNELSWDFQTSPLLLETIRQKTLSATFEVWRQTAQETVQETKRLEEENNRFFLRNNDYSQTISEKVPLSGVGLFCNPHFRFSGQQNALNDPNLADNPKIPDQKNQSDPEYFPKQKSKRPTRQNTELFQSNQNRRFQAEVIKDFISFGIGCLFNRYSLNKPGIISTSPLKKSDFNDHCDFQPSSLFAPQDNILTILESNPFSNNIIKQFHHFLSMSFGQECLEENILFIEQTLGKSLFSYFRDDFFSNHLIKFKKCPLYWLFSSSKGSFRAIAYYHQIEESLPKILLNQYLLPYQNHLFMINPIQGNSLENNHEKKQFQTKSPKMSNVDFPFDNKNLPQINEATMKSQSSATSPLNPQNQSLNHSQTASFSKEIKFSQLIKKRDEFDIYAQNLASFISSPVPINKDEGIRNNYLKYQSILQPIRLLCPNQSKNQEY